MEIPRGVSSAVNRPRWIRVVKAGSLWLVLSWVAIPITLVLLAVISGWISPLRSKGAIALSWNRAAELLFFGGAEILWAATLWILPTILIWVVLILLMPGLDKRWITSIIGVTMLYVIAVTCTDLPPLNRSRLRVRLGAEPGPRGRVGDEPEAFHA